MIPKHKARRTLKLWELGVNTYGIAVRLNMAEAEVYNILAKWRG